MSEKSGTTMRRRNVLDPSTQNLDADPSQHGFTAAVKRNLHRLDVYPKLQTDFRVKTSSGAAIYVVMGIILFTLSAVETWQYLSPPTIDVIEVDSNVDVRLRISLNLTFFALSCAKVDIIAMDVAGEHQLHVDHEMHKVRLSNDGLPIGEKITMAPIARPNTTQSANVTEIPEDYCGSCYGAELEDGQCCNTCDELKQAYVKKGWSSAAIAGDRSEQCKREKDNPALAAKNGEGCLVEGNLTVNKVAGNFHIAVGTTKSVNGRLIHAFDRTELFNFNASHRINSLTFGTEFEGQKNPLSGQTRVLKKDTAQSGVWQYYVKLIPFATSTDDGEVHHSNQYSFTEKFTPLGRPYTFSALPGVFVIYDYSPFLLHRKTKSNSLLRYLIRLCGAAGGIYALGGLLDKLIIAFSTLLKKDA